MVSPPTGDNAPHTNPSCMPLCRIAERKYKGVSQQLLIREMKVITKNAFLMLSLFYLHILYTSEPDMIGGGAPFALTAGAYHISCAILIGA